MVNWNRAKSMGSPKTAIMKVNASKLLTRVLEL